MDHGDLRLSMIGRAPAPDCVDRSARPATAAAHVRLVAPRRAGRGVFAM